MLMIYNQKMRYRAEHSQNFVDFSLQNRAPVRSVPKILGKIVPVRSILNFWLNFRSKSRSRVEHPHILVELSLYNYTRMYLHAYMHTSDCPQRLS